MDDDATTRRCACTALRKASRAVSRLYDDALAETGLTTNQFSILRTLAREGDLPLSRLAESMVMDRTSLYRTLGPIERQGWIEIVAAGSGKVRIARLTPAGRATMAQATPLWEAVQHRVAGSFGVEGWAALEAALHGLTTLAVAAAR
jgi:DNA-binding MarR family transcriptional regulator